MSAAAPTVPWPSGYQTRRVAVRPLCVDDLDFIAALHADPAVMRHVGDVSAGDATDIARRLLRAAQRIPPTMHAWMLQTLESGARIGLMTVAPTAEPSYGELGLMFHPRRSQCGYATEVVAALLEHVHAAGGGLVARHRPDNLPVRRLMLRLGFIPRAGQGGYVRWRSRADAAPRRSAVAR